MTQYSEYPNKAQSFEFCGLFFVSFFSIFSVVAFFANDLAPIDTLTAVFVVFVGFFFVLGALFGIWCLRKEGMDKIEQSKRDLLIGFGGIAVCSMIPRIGLSFVDYNRVIIIPLVTLPIIAMFLIQKLFICGCGRVIKSLNYEEFSNRNVIIIIGSLFLEFLTFKYNGSHMEMTGQLIQTNFLQILFTFLSTACAVDFLTVLANEFDIRTAESRAIMASGAHIRRQKSVETSEPSSHDLIMFCYMLLAVSSTFSALFIQFYIGNVKFNWPLLIASGFATISIIHLLRKIVLDYFERNGMTKNEQCEFNLKIGLGVSLAMGFCGSIGVFFVETNVDTISFIIFITLITSITLYYHFILGFRKTHNLDYVNTEDSISIVILINIILFLISIRIGMCYEDQIAQKVICVTQLFFFALTTSSSVDLTVVLMGGVYLKRGNEKLVQTKTVVREVLVKSEPKSFPIIVCPGCKLEYSDTKTPRILKGCGHTVCEGCADNQIKNNKYISCPTCWTVLVVKGPASTLVKNYSLLDAIQETKG